MKDRPFLSTVVIAHKDSIITNDDCFYHNDRVKLVMKSSILFEGRIAMINEDHMLFETKYDELRSYMQRINYDECCSIHKVVSNSLE